MTIPSIRELQSDVMNAQSEVEKLERVYGTDSAEYRQALLQLTRLWSVLRLKRGHGEFLKEIR